MIDAAAEVTTHPGSHRRSQAVARPSLGPVALPVAVLGTVLATVTLTLTVLLSPASAHTDLLQGSPGPAQQVGGTVDFVDLVFVEPVSNARMTVEDPNGNIMVGTTVVTEGQIIRHEMPPLDIAGRYIMRYAMTSADGDFTESGYFFIYEPGAVPPVRLGEVDVPNSNATIVTIIASIVFGLCLIGLVMIFLTKLERDRAKAAAADQ